MSTPATTTDPTPNGAGTPGDLLSELVSAVRAEPRDPAEGLVAAAFSLGWYLRALCREPGSCVIDAVGGYVGGLTEEESIGFCLRHVEVGCTKLARIVEKAGQTPLEPTTLAASIRNGGTGRCTSARQLHVDAFSILSAVDFRIGRAYRLGGELLDLTVPPAERPPLEEHLSDAAVAPIAEALDDLTSAFPPHAGQAVCASLKEWNRTARGKGVKGELAEQIATNDDRMWRCLHRQGQLWRALLSGEKAGRDMLEIGCYLDAAHRLSVHMRQIARRFIRDFPLAVLLVVALFAGGAYAVIDMQDYASTLAGAGAVLASLGLTWKGLGAALGRIAREVEQPLWGAEIDVAVTQAITLIKLQRGRRDPSRERRQFAVAAPRHDPAAQGPA